LSRCLLEEDDSDLSDGDIPLLPQNHGMYQWMLYIVWPMNIIISVSIVSEQLQILC
jgi:hypothetical protein